MVNYFLVGLANRRAEITRRGTKRPRFVVSDKGNRDTRKGRIAKIGRVPG